MPRLPLLVVAIAFFVSGFSMSSTARAADEPVAPAETAQRFFELRTYTTAEGRLDALHARFRNHTNRLFKKHGIELIGYWTPTDPEKSKNTLVYILAYPSLEAREKAWKDFQDDPEWKTAKADSEKDGKIVIHVDSVYMTPTDFSPMK